VTNIYRSRIALTGWPGAPGVNTIYWTKGTLSTVGPTEVANWHQDLADAWEIFGGYCVDNWTLTVQAQVDVLDVESGELVDIVISDAAEPTWSQTTAVDSALSRASQLVVALYTDQFFAGRRLAGRTFLGPINTEAFTEDGEINSTCISAVSDAANAINSGTGPRWAIYSRPKTGAGAHVGRYGDIVNAVCRPFPAVLRSRRD